MQVPFFNYPHVYKQYEEELRAIMHEVSSRGAFILQKDKVEFEKNLAAFSGAKHALGVANGTDAIILALRAAGIGAGDEVIFSSHTYVATAASIHFVGATPVPVECGEDLMLDPDAIGGAITPKTRAIMPTQLNGRCCDMGRIMAMAEEHGLLVVEDAAQGLGATFRGRAAGTFGVAGTISFYPAKNLGSFGDAGAILTNDSKIFETCYLLHDHGRNQDGEVVSWGLNSRMDNLQAAILNFKLGRYQKEIARRRSIASQYQAGLGDMNQLNLPPAPDSDPDYFDVYQNYEIRADRRDELQAYLREKGVASLVQWGGRAVHQMTELGFSGTGLPFTENVFKRCLMIPMNTSMSDAAVAHVIESIRSFYSA